MQKLEGRKLWAVLCTDIRTGKSHYLQSATGNFFWKVEEFADIAANKYENSPYYIATKEEYVITKVK